MQPDPRFIQNGQPTLLAKRLDTLGFQSALDGAEPDFRHAWRHVGDEEDDLVDHLAAKVLIDGFASLHRFEAGHDFYCKQMEHIGIPNTAANRRSLVNSVKARLQRLSVHDGGWDPSTDLTRIIVTSGADGRITLDRVRQALQATSTSEANRVLLRLTTSNGRVWIRVNGQTVELRRVE